jgi:hypothetical protein
MRAIAQTSRGLKVLALALAAANVLLWFAVPWLRHALDPRLASPHRPILVHGLQELLVYYDPWLSHGVFPFVYTLGFVAIAFLFRPDPNPIIARPGCADVAILLLGLEAVWLFLVAFAILFRGPNWSLYWPWEEWDPKGALWYGGSFSDDFWWVWAGQAFPGISWAVHEAPGLLLLSGYFSLGLLVARTVSWGTGYYLAYCCFFLLMCLALPPLIFRSAVAATGDVGGEIWLVLRVAGLIFGTSYLFFRLLRVWCRPVGAVRPMAYGRCVLLVFLVQLAALVPIKMVLYWTFGLKYLIFYGPAPWVNV